MRRLPAAMPDPHTPPSAEEQLRRNIEELMEFYGMRQVDLAERMGHSQSWLSRRMSGKAWDDGGSRFQLEDLDVLATIFGLSPAELLERRDGNWNRRTGNDRRSGDDRRQRRPYRPPAMMGGRDGTPLPPLPMLPPHRESAE